MYAVSAIDGVRERLWVLSHSRTCIISDEALYRPAEVDHLLGDASRARSELGWTAKVSFEALIEMMVDADVARHQARLAGVPVMENGVTGLAR